MNKNSFTVLLVTLVAFSITSCSELEEREPEEGVVINGVRWATRNVSVGGSFARNPQDVGQFRQWNRWMGWAASDHMSNPTWDSSNATGSTWTGTTCPCPTGWRIPTQAELQSLGTGTWVLNWNETGVAGRVFGTAPNQIFLPAAGMRNANNGAFESGGIHGAYWSSTPIGTANAAALVFTNNTSGMTTGNARAWAFSIRCVAVD